MSPRIAVRIAPPRRAAAGFLCAFEFAGLGAHRTRYAAAPDPAQSLRLALAMISATLDRRVPALPVEIVWSKAVPVYNR